ncbi:MAG: flagellar hook-length control protein FliK [Rhodospirillales bacterium]
MNDILPLILKNAGETPVQGKQNKSSALDLSALSATFADLLQRAGHTLESGLSVVADYAAQPSTPERREPADEPKESAPETDTGARERRDDRADGADSRRDVPRDDHQDGHGRERSEARPSDGADNQPARETDPNATARTDDRPQDQNPSANAADGGDNAAAADQQQNTGGEAGVNRNQGETQNAAEGTGNAQTQAAGSDGTAAANPGLENAAAILGQLIALAEASLAKGQAQDTGQAANSETTAAGNALQGLAKAIAALGNHGAQQQNAQNGNQTLAPELQAIAKAIVEARAQGKPVTEVVATTNTQTTTQQQAQALAQAIGEGNKAQINVKVTNEAATLVSQPTSNLSATAATANDGQTPTLHALQAAQNPAAAAQTPGAQQAAANNAAQAQTQQTTPQSTQTQTVNNTLASDAKTLGPVPANTAGHGATPGGGEGSTSGGSHAGTQDSQQTQHTNQTQAASTTKFNVPRQAVMDQITVNISRAVQAGLDRINIQLRPESLGRVDVHLEMAKDGKVSAVIHADNKDTLDMLQRDGKELVKALQDAGLNLDDGDISYNLRGQNAQEGGEDGPANGGRADNVDGDTEADDPAANDDFQEVDIIEEGRVNVRV